MTSLEFVSFDIACIALVGAVFFTCGRLWDRAGIPVGPQVYDPEAGADSIVAWLHEVGEDDPPPPMLALAPPPAVLSGPPATVPPPGPVRHYSALAAWQLEHDTRRDADTSVTKLEAYVVAGMVCRDQIDARAAAILAQARHALHALTGDLAA
jgi:hypothetical protein